MSFGRQRNMVRRAIRPDRDFHRQKRRRGLGRGSLLEPRRRTGLLARLIAAVLPFVRW